MKFRPLGDTWRQDGKQVFSKLVDFTHAIADVSAAPKLAEACTHVDQVHVACYAALESWISQYSPGVGRADPTRGGFALLSFVLQDAYKSAILVFLTAIGVEVFPNRLVSDGKSDKVEAAFSLAFEWNRKAMVMADSILEADVLPTSTTSNYATYSAYRDTIPEEATAAYEELQPYLSKLYAA